MPAATALRRAELHGPSLTVCVRHRLHPYAERGWSPVRHQRRPRQLRPDLPAVSEATEAAAPPGGIAASAPKLRVSVQS